MENLKDDLNPKFLFQSTHTNILVDAISGKLNLQNLAMNELVSRGFNASGIWVGFEQAKKEFDLDSNEILIDHENNTYCG